MDIFLREKVFVEGCYDVKRIFLFDLGFEELIEEESVEMFEDEVLVKKEFVVK